MKNDQDVLITLLRTDFRSYLRKVFSTLEGQKEFILGAHIDAIIWELEQLLLGTNRRLLICMPPRYLKSIIVSIAFTTWLLGQDPSLRIFSVSYSEVLAARFSRQCKLIMESSWYKEAFPGTKICRATRSEISTTKSGYRRAFSIEGGLTGFGANYIFIDDPMKVGDAMSEKERQNVVSRLEDSILTRFDDKKTGRLAIVMQRVHSDDIAGHLIRKGGYQVLSLSAIALKDEKIRIGENEYFERKKGDALHPARENVEDLEVIRKEIGNFNFAAQYQQHPEHIAGVNILPEHFGLYGRDYDLPSFDEVIISWDTANVAAEGNSYSVATIWGRHLRHYFLLDVVRQRIEFPNLVELAVSLANRYNASYVLVEAAASGHALAQTLLQQYSIPVVPIFPRQDKVTRLLRASALLEQRRIKLPDRADWLKVFKDEIFSFPNCGHDDQVDSMVQFLNYMISRMPYGERPIIFPLTA